MTRERDEDDDVIDSFIHRAVAAKARNTEGILMAAADLIEKHGWLRNEYFNSGGYCVIGAIHEITDDLYAGGESHQALMARNHFCDYLGIGRNELVKWNSRPWRSQAGVVRKLRKAAVASRPDWYVH